MSTRRLELDLSKIVEAMTASPEDPFIFYLDLEDGTVQSTPSGSIDFSLDDLPEEIADFEPDLDRQVAIPRNESRDDHDVMGRFAATVGDEEMASLLEVALHGKGAFARFREVIQRDRDLEESWFAFKDEADRARARQWLAELGIEAIDTSPARVGSAEPAAPRAVPAVHLVDLLLLGKPAGEAELLAGQERVRRTVRAGSPDLARRWFRKLARQLCEMGGVPWRRRFVEGTSAFDLDRFHLRVNEDTIELDVDVPAAAWEMFSPR